MRRARERTRLKEQKRGTGKKVALGLGAAMSAVVGFAPPVGAATFTVNSTSDTGDGTCDDTECTLREAVEAANAAPGADVVTFASTVTGTITLTDGQIYVDDDLTIQGPGAASLTIDGDGASRIFYASGTDDSETEFTISGLTLTGGNDGDGGAVYTDETILTITDSVLTGNTATSRGGAVYTTDGNFIMINSVVSDNVADGDYGGGLHIEDNDAGDILIRDSAITGNTADQGGGIMLYDLDRGDEVDGEHGATILRTTISGNTALQGGGIYLEDAYNNGGAVTIADSTISGNTADEGGGIYKGGGDSNDTDKVLTITNTTISGNTADTGGGIWIDDDDDQVTTLEHSTVVNNTAATAGGGIYRLGNDDGASTETFVISNSIVANNTAPDGDLAEAIGAEGSFVLSYSLVEDPGDATVTEDPAGSNLTGVDPQLGPLQDNGGSTETHKPNAGSPVIGAGDPDFVPPPEGDQRGFPRRVGRLDIGAVEVEATVAVADAAGTETDAAGATVQFVVTLSAPTSSAVTVQYATAGGTAASGADFTPASGTLTFAPGETSKTVTVGLVGDNDEEGTESFTLILSSPVGVAIADASGVGTIADDDVEDLGYRLVAADGGIFTFGDRTFHGSTGDMRLNKPIVGGATDVSDNDGYWIVASDGGVFTFNAEFFGSLGGQPLASPAVEIEPTPTGKGYWIVLANGKVHAFGDAQHFGDMAAQPLNRPVVGMSVTPSGKGYWLVAEDGGIFNFGDAAFFGSMGDKKLNAPVIDLAPAVDNQGYYLLGRDGGVFTFGSADFKGSTGAMTLNAPVVAMLVAPNGAGYWLGAADGGIFTFGTVPFLGSMGGVKLNSPVLDLIP